MARAWSASATAYWYAILREGKARAMEELSAEARELLDENPPRMGWAFHPDEKKDVLVERGTGLRD